MTKLILHGGETGIPNDSNKNYYREIVKGLTSPKILLCYFSRPKEEWQKLFNQDKERFTNYTNRNDLTFILAVEENLLDQIKLSNVIYLRGGKTAKLQAVLSKIENLDSLIKEKVVVGSSAGFYVLSKYYLGDNGIVYNGLGILPIKAFAHYDDSKKYFFQKLKDCGEDLEVIALPETKYKVIKNRG
jgi:peptidase E